MGGRSAAPAIWSNDRRELLVAGEWGRSPSSCELVDLAPFLAGLVLLPTPLPLGVEGGAAAEDAFLSNHALDSSPHHWHWV